MYESLLLQWIELQYIREEPLEGTINSDFNRVHWEPNIRLLLRHDNVYEKFRDDGNLLY